MIKNKTNKTTNVYDDDNIPQEDLPKNKTSNKSKYDVEPLPESSRPRQDGPAAEIASLC